MTAQRVLNVSGLPAYDISEQAPLWWGQLGLAVIEATMFAILIATYFYLRLSFDVWPPPGVQLPLYLPTVALVPLLLSVIGSWWSTIAAKKDDRNGMILGMGANLAFGAIFLVLRVMEWRSLNFKWSSDAHGTIVWMMLGIHTFDSIAGLLETVVLVAIVSSGQYGEKQRQGVHVDSVLWYFVVAIWLPLYAVIYWGPRWLGGL